METLGGTVEVTEEHESSEKVLYIYIYPDYEVVGVRECLENIYRSL